MFIRYQTKEELKTGGLSIGFTGYGGKHHIGPEFQLGHLAGDAYDEPVLLIKPPGGKSIHKDFRPPRAGGTTGEFYTKMLAEYREALAKLDDEFPHLAKRKPVLGGFVWFQGWNDMFNDDARNNYQANLVHLINDIRKEVGQPDLPVVIGELGNDGPKAGKSMLAIRAAQKAAAKALARTPRSCPPHNSPGRPRSRPMSPTGTTGTATPRAISSSATRLAKRCSS